MARRRRRRRKTVSIIKRGRRYLTVRVKGKKIRISRKKLPVTIVTFRKRTGGIISLRADRKRHALPAGWRISKSGRVYRETRRNRSDIKYI